MQKEEKERMVYSSYIFPYISSDVFVVNNISFFLGTSIHPIFPDKASTVIQFLILFCKFVNEYVYITIERRRKKNQYVFKVN